jgi:hypothetical protein
MSTHLSPKIKELLSMDDIYYRNKEGECKILSVEERLEQLRNLMERGNTKPINVKLSPKIKELLSMDDIYYRNKEGECKILSVEERFEQLRNLMGRK